MTDPRFPYAALEQFTTTVFEKIGCPTPDAHVATKALLAADLRGIDSHGIARLSGYVRLWKVGRINTQPTIQIIHQTPSTATVDGDSGLGLVVAPKAMQIAIDKAMHVGTGWVSVCNSNHFGIAGHHAMMALLHDMIGLATTNASALVAPTFSTERMLGTNPIAFAVPSGKEPPFVADFATAAAANGKLELLQRAHKETPEGWLQTATGLPTTDANALKHGGALLPLGGDYEHGSHKGYALASIVDILSGVLSGANYGPWVPPFPAYVPMPTNQPGKGVGHFFGAMRIDAFRTADAFKQDMDHWINRFKTAQAAPSKPPVQIPGEAERLKEQERFQMGIPLQQSVLTELNHLATEFQIEHL